MIQKIINIYNKEKEKKGYTATEIQIIERQAYYRGRADEELRWKDVKDDLTTVYLNGFYDGENKYKDKIKEKIKDLKENNNGDDYSLINVINILKDLL